MTGLPLSRAQQISLVLGAIIAVAALAGPGFASWLGSWGETSAAVENTTTLTYPLLAALSAWVASAPRRRRFEGLIDSAARSQVSILLRAVLVIAGLATLGTVVASAGIYIATGLQATFGQPQLLPLLVVCCGLVAAAAFGALCGSVLPSIAGPLVAVVAVYMVEVFADTGNARLTPLAGLIVADPRERTYRSTLSWVLEVRSVYLVALAVLFVALAARRPGSWLVPFSVVCLAATPLLLVGDANMPVSAAATKVVCTQEPDVLLSSGAPVTVCMTAARAHAASAVASALKPQLRALSGLAKGGVVLTEENVSSNTTAEVRDGVLRVAFGVVNGVDGDAHQVGVTDLRVQFIGRVLLDNCAAEDDAAVQEGKAPPATPNDVVAASLLSRSRISLDGSDGIGYPVLDRALIDYTPVEDFRSAWGDASTSERNKWLAEHGPDLVACKVTKQDTEGL